MDEIDLSVEEAGVLATALDDYESKSASIDLDEQYSTSSDGAVRT